METRFGSVDVSYSARGVPKYSLELWHDGLKKHRLIRDSSVEIIKRKAELQAADWDQRWCAVQDREKTLSQRVSLKFQQEKQKSIAGERTAEAQRDLEQLKTLLAFTLSVDDRIDWEKLKDITPFPERSPRRVEPPPEPSMPELPREPAQTDAAYTPDISVFDRLMPSRKRTKIESARQAFAADHAAWTRQANDIQAAHSAAVSAHHEAVRLAAREFVQITESWKARKEAHLEQQKSQHAMIDAKRASYLAHTPDVVIEYCDMVLSASKYPNCFPQEFDLDYEPEIKQLIVDYTLPPPGDLPTLKAVKYVASRETVEEQHIADSVASKQYDDALYQVVLRTIHELFEADTANALATVVFNGIVTSIDRGTGKAVTACVLSLRANRTEFVAINLAQVDPRACFKSLKGVGSARLHGLAAVAPIMPMRRDDGRFVSAYEVANTLDTSVNLAAMDWEDFEHLIRELFEKEFASSGGEVKVTQATRDGGVDAVAFDPDPIRGGKIVIQAKRYTNTVGVGAVRDLYGTVLNEGATKGVLVTTSDYGPDSYTFASGKPLVLLNGANLLHMLERHGHKARIDIREARRTAAQ
ncbi:MAG: restriction endonuclease [Gammaproteobacteria bacterium]